MVLLCPFWNMTVSGHYMHTFIAWGRAAWTLLKTSPFVFLRNFNQQPASSSRFTTCLQQLFDYIHPVMVTQNHLSCSSSNLNCITWITFQTDQAFLASQTTERNHFISVPQTSILSNINACFWYDVLQDGMGCLHWIKCALRVCMCA